MIKVIAGFRTPNGQALGQAFDLTVNMRESSNRGNDVGGDPLSGALPAGFRRRRWVLTQLSFVKIRATGLAKQLVTAIWVGADGDWHNLAGFQAADNDETPDNDFQGDEVGVVFSYAPTDNLWAPLPIDWDGRIRIRGTQETESPASPLPTIYGVVGVRMLMPWEEAMVDSCMAR